MIRYLGLLLLVLGACTNPETPSQRVRHFDLPRFIQLQEAALRKGSPVRKTVQLDQQSETQQLEGYTWAAELDLLRQWDINRPAWADEYLTDSTLLPDQGILFRYTARRKDLPVREMLVWLREGQADSLRIHTRVTNPLHTTEGHYTCHPGRYFRFRQTQFRRFGEDHHLDIAVSALSPDAGAGGTDAAGASGNSPE